MKPRLRSSLLSAAVLAVSLDADAQDRTQARSMVITQHGIVASEQTLASQAGVAIPARGGNAVLHNFKTKVNYGGSDPRKDGAAIPEANVK